MACANLHASQHVPPARAIAIHTRHARTTGLCICDLTPSVLVSYMAVSPNVCRVYRVQQVGWNKATRSHAIGRCLFIPSRYAPRRMYISSLQCHGIQIHSLSLSFPSEFFPPPPPPPTRSTLTRRRHSPSFPHPPPLHELSLYIGSGRQSIITQFHQRPPRQHPHPDGLLRAQP